MQQPWTRITNPADTLYDAVNPYFEAPYYGSDQELTIGPDGESDGVLHWHMTVDTTADPAHMPGGRRYVAQRIDPSWAPHVQ
jgi:hypothetical protein